MNVITARAMKRRNSGSGFFHKKQERAVRKGVPNGRYVNGRHVTKNRKQPS